MNLSPEMVKHALDDGQILLIDVREPHEFAAERIKGAENYPLSRFDPSALPDPEGKQIVLSCAGGVRSLRAMDQCQMAGLEVRHHLAGGLNAWKAAGLPTEK
jgi:rhodanese-related sulfurtransferase